MAETWEVILWVIVAVVFFIIIVVIIASVWACRKRNRRKKISRRNKGLEWGKIDQTDFGKKKVQYNVERGEIKILDEADAGVRSSHGRKVEYNAKTEEATISDVVDHDIRVEKQSLGRSEPNHDDQKPVREKTENTSFRFEEMKSSTSEVTKTAMNGGNKSSHKVKTEISQSENRERLQPLQTVPPQRSSNIHRSVNNYTNLGYSDTYHGTTQAPVARFQQPAAIVRAIVHPGSTGRVGRTKSLPRNFSKLSYKKKFSSSTTPRHKPISYNWSLEAKSSSGPQSWINVPIRIKEVHRPSRRRLTRHGPSDTIYSSAGLESEFEWDSDYNRWKYSRTLPQRRSRRSLMRRSLRKQREKQLAASRRSPPSNNIYITDSQPSYTRKQRGKQLAATQRSPPSNPIYITDSPPSQVGTAFRKEYYDRSLKQKNHDYQQEVHLNEFTRGSEVPCHSLTLPADKSQRRNAGDYYEENYRMVKRSEFPRKSSRTHQEEEPDMISISGSEFSDYLTGPPRPSDSQSDDHETWQRKMGRKDHDETDSSYSHGSFKEYSGRLQKIDKEVSREEVRSEQQMIDDRIRHSTTFHDTLKNLKNGNGKAHYSVKREETTSSTVQSPWQNNDSNFRKEHGVPTSGVPVLPPDPVFVQTV